jgi:hypothetical protein
MHNDLPDAVVPTMNVHDPDLPFLAAQAAVEIDNLLLGRDSTLDAVHALGELLKKSTEEIAGETGRKTLMDPPTVSVVSDALSATRSDHVRTLGEFAAEAWKVANELHEAKPNQTREKLERARLFCVTLSQMVTSYQQSVYDIEPAQQYTW